MKKTQKKKNKDFEATVVKVIGVETYLCNKHNEEVQDDRSYQNGESFRICVGPTTTGIEAGYKVEEYVEVKCGGTGIDERFLVHNFELVDTLTTIDASLKITDLLFEAFLQLLLL